MFSNIIGRPQSRSSLGILSDWWIVFINTKCHSENVLHNTKIQNEKQSPIFNHTGDKYTPNLQHPFFTKGAKSVIKRKNWYLISLSMCVYTYTNNGENFKLNLLFIDDRSRSFSSWEPNVKIKCSLCTA